MTDKMHTETVLSFNKLNANSLRLCSRLVLFELSNQINLLISRSKCYGVLESKIDNSDHIVTEITQARVEGFDLVISYKFASNDLGNLYSSPDYSFIHNVHFTYNNMVNDYFVTINHEPKFIKFTIEDE